MADDDLFLSRMRALGVRPIEDGGPRKGAKGGKTPREEPRLFDVEVDEDEARLFLQAMGALGTPHEATTEKARPVASTPSAEPAREPAGLDAVSVDPADVQLFLEAVDALEQAPVKDEPGLAADVLAVDGQDAVRKIKAPRGPKSEPTETLDLHRLRIQDALHHLRYFVGQAVENRSKVVLVITGKGHHSQDGVSVLRRSVEEWIRREGRSNIEAFADAPPALGGRGAFLLYLRSGGSSHASSR